MNTSPSVLDFFTIGLGPSCDHSVLPMRAARQFAFALAREGMAAKVHRLKVQVSGRFANECRVRAAMLLGLQGETPEEIEVEAVQAHLAGIRSMKSLRLPCGRVVRFDEGADISSQTEAADDIRLVALDAAGETLFTASGTDMSPATAQGHRIPFRTGLELARMSRESGHDISTLMLRHEASLRPEQETRAALLHIWQTMQKSVESGCAREEKPSAEKNGRYRAAWLHRELSAAQISSLSDPLSTLDWVGLWAIAVSEENAAGGRVVAVPTNETSGILPAVLQYLARVREGSKEERITRFLLTAGAIASICTESARAANVETSLACAMAAAALCEALGGSTEQVITAAALGLESHRGNRFSTAEYPAIGEPNAIAAVTAINTARMALRTRQPDTGLLDRVISHLQSAI